LATKVTLPAGLRHLRGGVCLDQIRQARTELNHPQLLRLGQRRLHPFHPGHDVLGEATYESPARKGETMTTAAMVTHAYDQIDQARTELNAVSK